LQNAPEAVQLAALDAAAKLALRSQSALLVEVVGNESAPGEVRARALEVLDRLESSEIEAGIRAAERSSAPALRLAALQILAKESPERALPVVRRLATDGNEAEQRAAFTALGQLDQPEAPRLLVLGLDRLAAGKVHPDAQVELLDVVEKSTDRNVQARWNKLQADWAASGDALAPYRSALGQGNPWRGYGVFYNHPALACIRCHQVNGNGGQAGPDLTLIGAQKSPEYLLESVVEPNAQIAQGFNLVTLKLKDGSYESGSLMSESANEIILKRADGSEAKLDPNNVVERQAAPSSMPDIYKQTLTRTELRDLITFLRALTVAQPRMGEQPRALSGAAAQSTSGGHGHE
jgi:quinoprotein glucose dehydrogenase